MNTISKPMLASKCERPDLLPFPVLATPKLDGIRCLKLGGKALTRSFKPISNRFAREWIEATLPDGLDGELMLRGGTFSETTSAIGARDGRPDCVLQIADCRLQIADCRLQIADCRLQIADCGLRIADCGLRIADCRLRIADCELRIGKTIRCV